jgi:hypothetical protein
LLRGRQAVTNHQLRKPNVIVISRLSRMGGGCLIDDRHCSPIAMNILGGRMYKIIKSIAAGVGAAAVLTAGLGVAIQASDDSTSTYSSSGGAAGETVTMSPAATTLDTPSFKPAAKAQVPCGFEETGGC